MVVGSDVCGVEGVVTRGFEGGCRDLFVVLCVLCVSLATIKAKRGSVGMWDYEHASRGNGGASNHLVTKYRYAHFHHSGV